jgi:hypothetical protein
LTEGVQWDEPADVGLVEGGFDFVARVAGRQVDQGARRCRQRDAVVSRDVVGGDGGAAVDPDGGVAAVTPGRDDDVDRAAVVSSDAPVSRGAFMA